MDLELLTLGGALYQGKAREVTLTTTSGQATILPHHAAYTATVTSGPVTVREAAGKTKTYDSFGGVLSVRDNVMRLLIDQVEPASEGARQQIETASQAAARLKAELGGKASLHRAQEMLNHPSGQLDVSHLKRRHRHSGG
jgi:F0F1-type ATP synthase epsilon subunit